MLTLAGDQYDCQQGQHDQCRGRAQCNGKRPSVHERCRYDRDARIGDDRHGAHRREVQPADGRSQQYWRDPKCAAALQSMPTDRSGGCERDADQDRRRHEVAIPGDASGDDPCPHPDEVHGTDPRTDDGATRGGHYLAAARRNTKSHNGHRRGNEQRSDRQNGLVARGVARMVGKHRHEMGRPDAGTGTKTGQEHPGQALRAQPPGSVRVGVEGGKRGRRADRHRQHHESDVVIRNTGEDAKHEAPRVETLR